MKRGLPLLAALLALLPAAGRAEVYKCRLADGRVEISNTGCANASTLSVRRDETVSPESRAQAERDVEHMRQYVEQREAAERRAASNRPSNSPAPAGTSPPGTPPPPAAVEECLRDLERQAMAADKRAEMALSCRSTATAPAIADDPPIYLVGGASSACLRNVARLNLSPAELARRIEHCRGFVPPPLPQTTAPAKPAETAHALCPPGQLNCGR